MIKNPILPGFNADPCICRKGDDYYIVVSSFEWLPGLPVYHSKDLKNWELITHILAGDASVDLKRLPSSKGIWAPCVTYCEAEDLFYAVYGVMNSMNARYFDVDNYLITSNSIEGPWSEPVYLHSAGFDASILHDEDGRKWIVSLEWETRDGYEKPGAICLVEYSPEQKKVLGYPKRIWNGGTDRGCIEGPHLTKRGEYYYLMCAEGGTGYYHGVTVGRSKSVEGPYESDPMNPIVTSVLENHDERADVDHLRPHYYNPDVLLQKAGHGCYVETATGEVYMVHLCSRPFAPELRCTLGRETAIQKMEWTADGWLRLAGGGSLALEYVEESNLPEAPGKEIPEFDDFDSGVLGLQYYAPRILPEDFADVTVRPGYVRIRGQESRTSLNKASILARKLTSVHAIVTTKMEFHPEVYQHSAGLIMYYDNMNYVNLRKYYSETLDQSALSITSLENGEKREFKEARTSVTEDPLYLRVVIAGREFYFEWSYDGLIYERIGENFDLTKLSDEYCKFGEFTGAFVGLTCADRLLHEKCADFDFFEYKADYDKAIN